MNLAATLARKSRKKHCDGLDMLLSSSPRTPSTSTGVSVRDCISAAISPLDVIKGMLEDAVVCVKLFYVPHTTSTYKARVQWAENFDIFETVVGADGLEYPLVAKGPTAARALMLFQRCAGQVVTLQHKNIRATKVARSWNFMRTSRFFQQSRTQEHEDYNSSRSSDTV